MIIARSEIETAAQRIGSYLQPTPLLHSRFYSQRTGADVYLKLETLQPTHSFKVRGAFNAILALSEELRRRGIVAASGGNHGMGVALASATLGIPASIYLPQGTPGIKVETIQALGAEVVLHGEVWDEANGLAMRVAQEQDQAYIHPFDNTQVMAGQATMACELLDNVPDLDLIVASIGGGGLVSGILSAVRQFSPRTRVIGVETVGADCMYRSKQANRIVELPAITSIAESLGAKRTEQTQFDIITQHAADLVVVSDREAIHAMKEALQTEKLLIEPAAACCLAALCNGKITVQPGEQVAVIMCGANVALERAERWFEEMEG